MPDSASIEPTDKSIPPEMITAVIPTPMIAFTLERRSTFSKLFIVGKSVGSRMDRKMTSDSRLANGRSWRMMRFMSCHATAARCITASGFVSFVTRSPASSPRRITRIRSATPNNSGSSDEMKRIALPCFASPFNSA